VKHASCEDPYYAVFSSLPPHLNIKQTGEYLDCRYRWRPCSNEFTE